MKKYRTNQIIIFLIRKKLALEKKFETKITKKHLSFWNVKMKKKVNLRELHKKYAVTKMAFNKKKCFHSWKKYSQEKHVYGLQKNAAQKALMKNLKKKSLLSLRDRALKKHQGLELLAKTKKVLKRNLIKRILSHWSVFSKVNSKTSKASQKIASQHKLKTLKAVFNYWHEKYLKNAIRQAQNEKAENYFNAHICSLSFILLKKAVALRKWKKSAQATANKKYAVVLAKKGLASWKIVTPHLHKRNELLLLLKSAQEKKIKQKVHRILKFYVDYKKNRRSNDMYSFEQTINIRKKKYLQIWINLHRKLTGFACLHNTYLLIQQHLALRKLRMYSDKITSLISVCEKQYKKQLKRRAIIGLRKYLE